MVFMASEYSNSIASTSEVLHFAEDLEFGYLVQSERDQKNVKRLRKLLSSATAPFGRSTDFGHVTATGFVVDSSRSHTLLLHHRKLNIWLPPGGHCDGDADVMQAALREAKEETGLGSLRPISLDIFDIDIHEIPANSREAEHYHFDVRFLLEADCNEQLINNEESNALRWVELENLDSLTNMPSILILKEKLNTP